uniref:Uncharacterized protein n=1 Tax=Arundo donax TaxID=35708 RepID=A0A0A8YRG1_ARUDO
MHFHLITSSFILDLAVKWTRVADPPASPSTSVLPIFSIVAEFPEIPHPPDLPICLLI